MTSPRRPPPLNRVPSRVRTTAAWVAAVLYVLSIPLLARGGGNVDNYVAPALCMLLLIGLLRRRPLITMALLIAGFWASAASSPSTATRVCEYILITVAVCVIAAIRPRKVSLAAAGMSLAAPILHVLIPIRTVRPSPGLGRPLWITCKPDLSVCFGPPVGDVPTNPTGGGVDLRAEHLFAIAGFVLILLVAWLIGDSIQQRRRHAEALRSQATVQAVTAERLRIARELHDMVAHSIGIIAIQSGVGSRVIDTQPAEARNALTAIEATSRETLAGLRRMLVALRQADQGPEAAAPPLDPAPGLADVERLAGTAANAGVRVDVEWRGERRTLPQEIDLSAFRIIQEAVTNVVRHAGTRYCRVTIEQRDGELDIEINDNGRGGPGDFAGGSGFGLVGMRERVGLLHGRFAAGPRDGGGFRVAVTLPVDQWKPGVGTAGGRKPGNVASDGRGLDGGTADGRKVASAAAGGRDLAAGTTDGRTPMTASAAADAVATAALDGAR